MNPAPGRAGAVLSVDLDALKANYGLLAAQAGEARTGASVKANAYGTGLAPAAQALHQAGCRDFFVAFPDEGAAVRAVLPGVAIYVLSGLLKSEAAFYELSGLVPVLAQADEVEEWADHCRNRGTRLAAALHVETGINRLGIAARDLAALLERKAWREAVDIRLLVSHLARGDELGETMNHDQLATFETVRRSLPSVPASLANSPGIFLGPRFRFDLVRPGLGLYGGNPLAEGQNPFRTVVRLMARVLQVKSIEPGEAVGYGSTWRASRPTRVAVIGAGYGDGYPRALSSGPGHEPARVYIAGRFAPIVGRVSMDMCVIDVTDMPENQLSRGAEAELIGDHVTLEDVARRAGTISYEILTRLGTRYARLYSGGESQ